MLQQPIVRRGLSHKEKEKFMSAGKFWIAFSIGLAAGAAVALLYAPQSGARTRRQLRRGMQTAGEYMKDTAETIGDQAQRYAKRGKDMAETVGSTATHAYGVARKVVSIVA